MKMRTKILFLIIVSFIIINYAINAFLKPVEVSYSGVNTELSLSNDVEVLFDDYGVPSVFAENDSDMFKVAGYLGARDRLFQMAFLKYAYKGQLSYVVNDTLFSEDRFLRTLGFEKIAQKTLKKVPADILKHLEDTCYGINAYVQSLTPSKYPLEFKLLQIDELPVFEPLDIVALSTMMAWELQGGWDSELFFGESGTMAVESALLGTPSITFSSSAKKCGNFLDLRDKYELLFYFEDDNKALNCAKKLLGDHESKSKWKFKSKKLNIIEGSLSSKERDVPGYIQVDDKNRSVKLVRVPKFAEVPYPVIMEPNLVIEYYSR